MVNSFSIGCSNIFDQERVDMNYQDFVKSVLTDAARIAKGSFGKVSGIVKSDDNNQVLTEADVEIGKMIVSEIRNHFPEHNIIDEEAGVIDSKSDYTWVVDPVDGTSNFAAGLPTYCVAIGLIHQSTPVVGGIVLPFFEELYLAEKGKGAYCNRQKLSVDKKSILSNSLIAYGIDGHRENPRLTKDECMVMANIILNCRNIRSSNSNYDSMLVAKGRYGAWLNRTSKIWDDVPPQVIIEEAGGVCTDYFGDPLDYSNVISKANDNFTVCLAAPQIYSELQKIIHL